MRGIKELVRRLKGKPVLTPDGIRPWVEYQIAEGVPRQEIWNYLNDYARGAFAPMIRLRISEQLKRDAPVERMLLFEMMERNRVAREMEKAGKIDDAIALYEKNIRDKFDSPHGYERLVLIYDKLGKHEEVMRVAQTYLLIEIRGNVNEQRMRWFEDKLGEAHIKRRALE